MKLEDQIVLVTGSSRGLGLAIARAFHREGARVVVNYVHTTPDGISALATEFGVSSTTTTTTTTADHDGAGDDHVLFVRADVTQADDVQSLFAAAERHFHRPITTVVNNAMVDNFAFNGDARPHIPDLTWHHFDAQLQGFLRGALNTTQAALPGFEKLGAGRVVNIGSNLFQNPVVPYHDYTAAKGALLAFTRTCAADLGPKGVTVNMVSGGLLRVTDASASTPSAVFEHIEAITPLRRVTTPDDVAGAVLFFASPWAQGVTGQQIVVDGGLVMN
ncbi:3-oxoacyl-[acyl-carrier protein] reductase [Fonsecaea erecta]|uniref:3-oxoacyl-[acyl-carrier protein] reductase n=1 Tax=Fonsecaea erecta TaxID=1367422 RepID=A0A178ZCI1_9EURO|nr:3-oxoacyl-[acyl-carrier protein] reductase [Fonsecaea erecta]OAP57469.1 3-oxoacyl-[acyl-carrier protein] reductase [Fonsecaea erecta]